MHVHTNKQHLSRTFIARNLLCHTHELEKLKRNFSIDNWSSLWGFRFMWTVFCRFAYLCVIQWTSVQQKCLRFSLPAKRLLLYTTTSLNYKITFDSFKLPKPEKYQRTSIYESNSSVAPAVISLDIRKSNTSHICTLPLH